MVYKACTFGLREGPCYTMPTVAIWSERGGQRRRIWACEAHDKALEANLRRAKSRSGWRRQSVGQEV